MTLSRSISRNLQLPIATVSISTGRIRMSRLASSSSRSSCAAIESSAYLLHESFFSHSSLFLFSDSTRFSFFPRESHGLKAVSNLSSPRILPTSPKLRYRQWYRALSSLWSSALFQPYPDHSRSQLLRVLTCMQLLRLSRFPVADLRSRPQVLSTFR
jgi:hypothetical protein